MSLPGGVTEAHKAVPRCGLSSLMIYTREQLALEWEELRGTTLTKGGLNLVSPGVAPTVTTCLLIGCNAEQKATSVVFLKINKEEKLKMCSFLQNELVNQDNKP